MSAQPPKIESLISDAATRLLARADENYALQAADISPRLTATLHKYLLRDEPLASEASLVQFLDQLQAGDICLAIACERGNAAAWNDLVARYSPTVRSAARSAAGSEDAADDLAQSIWAELHGLRTREDGRPASKLAYYSGRGSFAGWLRAVVAQLAVDQHRKVSRLVQTEDDAEFDRIADDKQSVPASRLDPEQELTGDSQRRAMEQALATAVADMEPEDRLLVKLYYFDNLRLKEAGAVLGVHEATASRRLTRIHGDLRQRVEQILSRERNWTKSEIAAAFSEVAMNLHTDFAPLLSD